MNQRLEIQIPQGIARTRLEDFLFGYFPGLSRMYLRRIIKDEKCEVNGRLENVGFRVRGGDFIEVELDPTRENSMRPENVPLDILYEDEYLAVVIKPAGMLVHPTNRDKNGTLLNALAFHFNAKRGGPEAESGTGNAGCGPSNAECGVSNAECGMRNAESVRSTANGLVSSTTDGTDSAFRIPHSAFETPHSAFETPHSALEPPHPAVIRPGLVHRLDRQTSGVMVIAKSSWVHRRLARQFQRKTVEKMYLALVDGLVDPDEGVIDAPVGRYAAEKRWALKTDGKSALTRFNVLRRNVDTTLLALEPVTGRTNQLRIHCASIGHPIVGDVSRGGRAFERLCLHACKLSFDHPTKGHRLTFEIDAPAEFLCE